MLVFACFSWELIGLLGQLRVYHTGVSLSTLVTHHLSIRVMLHNLMILSALSICVALLLLQVMGSIRDFCLIVICLLHRALNFFEAVSDLHCCIILTNWFILKLFLLTDVVDIAWMSNRRLLLLTLDLVLLLIHEIVLLYLLVDVLISWVSCLGDHGLSSPVSQTISVLINLMLLVGDVFLSICLGRQDFLSISSGFDLWSFAFLVLVAWDRSSHEPCFLEELLWMTLNFLALNIWLQNLISCPWGVSYSARVILLTCLRVFGKVSRLRCSKGALRHYILIIGSIHILCRFSNWAVSVIELLLLWLVHQLRLIVLELMLTTVTCALSVTLTCPCGLYQK